MAAMRQSRMELATTFYTDPVPQDVAGAVGMLPDVSKKAPGTTSRDLKTGIA